MRKYRWKLPHAPQGAIAFNRQPQATKAICLHVIPLNAGMKKWHHENVSLAALLRKSRKSVNRLPVTGRRPPTRRGLPAAEPLQSWLGNVDEPLIAWRSFMRFNARPGSKMPPTPTTTRSIRRRHHPA